MESQLIKGGYIPLDKSWIIRMGVLDLLNNYNDIFEFLKVRQNELSDDLQALHRALKSWKAGEQNIDVGESATLYRFLKFTSWVLGENKRFILRGTLQKRKTSFVPQQPEDYCFARTFGLITKEQGKSLWPSLQGHESDRIEEMEWVIETVNAGGMIESQDHRTVQAGCMLQKFRGMGISAKYPWCVNKSWPRFWDFLSDTPSPLVSV